MIPEEFQKIGVTCSCAVSFCSVEPASRSKSKTIGTELPETSCNWLRLTELDVQAASPNCRKRSRRSLRVNGFMTKPEAPARFERMIATRSIS